MGRKRVGIIAGVAAGVLSVSMLFAAPPQKAETGHRDRARGEHRQRSGDVYSKLDLTDGQKQDIRSLQRKFRQENKDLYDQLRQSREQLRDADRAGDTARQQELTATMDAQRAALQEKQKGLEEQMLEVLTPKQRNQLDELRAEQEKTDDTMTPPSE